MSGLNTFSHPTEMSASAHKLDVNTMSMSLRSPYSSLYWWRVLKNRGNRSNGRPLENSLSSMSQIIVDFDNFDFERKLYTVHLQQKVQSMGALCFYSIDSRLRINPLSSLNKLDRDSMSSYGSFNRAFEKDVY